jgi:hypothetical protein
LIGEQSIQLDDVDVLEERLDDDLSGELILEFLSFDCLFFYCFHRANETCLSMSGQVHSAEFTLAQQSTHLKIID